MRRLSPFIVHRGRNSLNSPAFQVSGQTLRFSAQNQAQKRSLAFQFTRPTLWRSSVPEFAGNLTGNVLGQPEVPLIICVGVGGNKLERLFLFC